VTTSLQTDPQRTTFTTAAQAVAFSLLIVATPAGADELKVNGLIQLWATGTLDSVLTSAVPPPNTYYDLRREFASDTFSVRRAELAFSGHVDRRVGFRVMVDPSIGALSSDVLQDALISVDLAGGLVFRAGQMKTLQTYEGLESSARLALVERGQLTRRFGDVRDRGVTLSWDRAGRRPLLVSLGVFNGAGKANDANGAKDVAFRVECGIATAHRLGAYGLRGSTDQPRDRAVPLDMAGAAAPTPDAVLKAADTTSQAGAFYLFDKGGFEAALEVLTGRLGRRHASLGTSPGPARREHVEQRLFGFQATAKYAQGRHQMAARYDRLDYNAGGRWYTDHDPYRESGQGAARDGDFTPVFTELSLGYTLAFDAADRAAANFKVAYVSRVGGFLISSPSGRVTRSRASLVAALQVAF
jgi:hypothetical protein